MKIDNQSYTYTPPTDDANAPANDSATQWNQDDTLNNSQATSYFQNIPPSSPSQASPAGISAGDLDSMMQDIEGVQGSSSAPAPSGAVNPQDFMEFLKSLSPEDRQQVHDFHEKVAAAIKNGPLDQATVSALTQEVPEPLQNYASDHGMSLEQLVQNSAKFIQHGHHHGGGPLHKEFQQYMDSENTDPTQQNDVREFMGQLVQDAKSGDTDLSSLATQAPDAVISFAAYKGIPVSDLLQQMIADNPKPAPMSAPAPDDSASSPVE